MVVPTRANWSGKDDTSGIDSIPYLLQVASSSNLFDKYRRQTLRPEFLVDAEEVDFGTFDFIVADSEGSGNSRNKGDQLSRRSDSHTDVPLLKPAW